MPVAHWTELLATDQGVRGSIPLRHATTTNTTGGFMKRNWSENSAKLYLLKTKADIDGKLIKTQGGFDGLTACSAADYLVNYCGYRVFHKPRT